MKGDTGTILFLPLLFLFPRQRDEGQILVEVTPFELSDLLMRTKQAAIRQKATEEEILVERLSVRAIFSVFA